MNFLRAENYDFHLDPQAAEHDTDRHSYLLNIQVMGKLVKSY